MLSRDVFYLLLVAIKAIPYKIQKFMPRTGRKRGIEAA
jgi:hypothetical protein